MKNTDLFVLIIGGRYGSEKSEGRGEQAKKFHDRYDSITRQEHKSAIEQDIPIYVLIDQNVQSEYQTYLQNKDNTAIKYAHVDSINIFVLIEEILAQRRNNPVQSFSKMSDVEDWLRDQWAGIFRELLKKRSEDRQISSLSAQVVELAEQNKTLKTYLENLMRGASREELNKVIKTESNRLERANAAARLRANPFVTFATSTDEEFTKLRDIIMRASDAASFIRLCEQVFRRSSAAEMIKNVLVNSTDAQRDLNSAREILGKPKFDFSDFVETEQQREAAPGAH